MVFFIIIGIIMIVMIAGSGVPVAGLFILVVIVMMAFVMLRFAFAGSAPPPADAPGQPVFREVHIETVKETIKVRCRYCGTLNLDTDMKCQSCGATL